MSYLADQHRAELERYRQIRAYYSSIRRPVLEWSTFSVAFLMTIAVSLVTAGYLADIPKNYRECLIALRWVSLVAFAFSDSALAKFCHPVPHQGDGFNPVWYRVFEKFAAQGRSWQLFLVLFLPVATRFFCTISRLK